jgi:hypothetical protein
MPKTFKEDHRTENPALHLLYVKTGVKHLRAIDECMKKFQEFSNLNLYGAMDALRKERAKLVTENAAYADADEILLSLAGKEKMPEEVGEM